MAMEWPKLREALIAWSAGHLALRDGRYHSVALEARSLALQLLVQSLPAHGIAAGEINAATSLVLMASEHIIMATKSAGTTRGGTELHGPEALKQTSEGQWILRNFTYHDIIGSVTLGKKPLLESHFLADLVDSLDTYLGVAFGILIIISEISSVDGIRLALDYLQSARNAHESTFNFFTTTEQKLEVWVCPRPPETDSALISLANAYRASALIYLYRRTLRELRLHGAIQGEMSTILQYLSTIPVSGVVESALLFPCFIAGSEATDRGSMDRVRLRMHEMSRKRGFSNIQQALGVLEDVWEERNSAKHGLGNYEVDMDWRDIDGRRDEDLLLT
ncbi:fungal-specific transcription factor domain-containing protein [Aspergillus filifer]